MTDLYASRRRTRICNVVQVRARFSTALKYIFVLRLAGL
jgi:hypothetical protein